MCSNPGSKDYYLPTMQSATIRPRAMEQCALTSDPETLIRPILEQGCLCPVMPPPGIPVDWTGIERLLFDQRPAELVISSDRNSFVCNIDGTVVVCLDRRENGWAAVVDVD